MLGIPCVNAFFQLPISLIMNLNERLLSCLSHTGTRQSTINHKGKVNNSILITNVIDITHSHFTDSGVTSQDSMHSSSALCYADSEMQRNKQHHSTKNKSTNQNGEPIWLVINWSLSKRSVTIKKVGFSEWVLWISLSFC